MEKATWLFWLKVLIAIVSALLTGLWLRWRRLLFASCSGSTLALAVWAAGDLWSFWGVCLLPHREVVEYRDGMTLCPQQSAIMAVPIPAPRLQRDL